MQRQMTPLGAILHRVPSRKIGSFTYLSDVQMQSFQRVANASMQACR